MPFSAEENGADVIKFVESHDIRWVLDVGPGAGRYGKLLGPLVDRIDAVEVWEPYVDRFGLRDIYNMVQVADVRDVGRETFALYDLVIFGDVLEHMSREDSITVWERTSQAAFALISVPIIHYPQGTEFNNPYEIHMQEHMKPEEIERDYGPFVWSKQYKVTGTFIGRRSF